MTYQFKTPTIDEGPIGPDRLSQFYTLPRAISVLKSGDRYQEVRYPTQTEVAEAQKFYQGGYVHIISDEDAQELIDAGYEDYLTEI
jgi:hypothetical protein